MSTVALDGVRKQFGDVAVVRDFSLDVADGEIVALLGPSGSGKTTLLRLIAGFEQVDGGRIVLGGDDVTSRPPVARRCGMVFQHYALFPHLDVAGNVGYGLSGERLDRAAMATRIAEVLELVDLSGYERRPVTALSGGQQQRVALARALAPRPRVLLLDEPLSNLDPTLRERTRRELRELVRRIGITTILVTHEQEEAFDIADRIALLHQGRLEQVGTPEELYSMPATQFVAGFIGRSVTLPGEVIRRVGDSLEVAAAGITWRATGAAEAGQAVRLAIRPEALRADPSGTIAGAVVRRRFAGASWFLTVRLDDGAEVEVAATSASPAVGDRITLALAGPGAHAFAHDAPP
ncbi:MAG: ABC transporter ATP-binding protein [Gemmatimonadales bacterium]|nr:ABC transporter ATP-binding protein [Gemmatimonadales bacterium]